MHWILLPPTFLIGASLLVVAAAWAVRVADEGKPAIVDRRAIGVVTREATARSLFTLLRWLPRRRAPQRAIAGVEHRRTPPVLLLPGLDFGPSSLFGLTTFLRRRGWPWVWAAARGGRDEALAERAQQLAGEIHAYRSETGADRIDIVAFGTGGLLAGWYLRHHPDAPVRRLVTIATPWGGTRIAVFQRGRAATEVLPGSHLLDGLQPSTVPTTCIWSPDDPIVVPTTSAIPSSPAQSVRIEGAGHVEMLLSARVYRAVQAALSQPSATQPGIGGEE